MSEKTLQTDAANWHIQAALAELLSQSFAYPTEMLIEALASGEYAEAMQEIIELSGIDVAQDSLAQLESYEEKDPEELLHVLRIEATRLFIGSPHPVTSPFEGVWRAKEDGVEALLFVNPHSMAVERFMKSCGVGQAEGKNEPLDHVATELEFLEYLAGLEAGIIEANLAVEVPEDGWAGAYQRFLDEHPKTWMPQFADAVIAETREPFYKVAASLLKEFIAAR